MDTALLLDGAERLGGDAGTGSGTGGASVQQQQADPHAHGEEPTAAFTRAYVSRVRQHRRCILVTWSVLLLLGFVFAPKFLDTVVLVFKPPPGTPGEEADRVFQEEFPGQSHDADTLVLLNTRDAAAPILRYEAALRDLLVEVAANVVAYGQNKAKPASDFQAIHYFELRDLSADAAAHMLLNNSTHPSHATAMIATFHLKSGFEQGSMEGQRFSDWLDKELGRAAAAHLSHTDVQVQVRATGMLAFVRDMQQGTEQDMIKMDSLSMPLAFAVLAYMLKSVRLLLIPILNIVLTTAVAFTIMYPVALATTVIAVAPSSMMSIAVAFSIDYSLFLLTRWREEMLKGADCYDAVVLMVDSAGHTILVSGATIAVCWLGLLFFPVALLSTIGLGAGLTVVVAFLVNISLMPALLITWEGFFSDFDNFGTNGCCSCLRGRCSWLRSRFFGASRVDDGDDDDDDVDVDVDVDAEADMDVDIDMGGASSSSSSSSSAAAAAQSSAPNNRSQLLRRESTSLESPCLFDAFGRRSVLSPQVRSFSTMASPLSPARTPTLNADGSVAGLITQPKLFGKVDPIDEIAFLRKHSPWFACGERLYGTPLRALCCIVVVCACVLPLAPYALGFHHSEDFKLFTPSDSIATVTAVDMEGLYGGGRLAPYELLVEPREGTLVLSNEFFHHVQDVLLDVLIGLDYGEGKPRALSPLGISAPMMMTGANISFTPTLGGRDQLSIVGCAVDDVGYALSICAAHRCAAELKRCRSEDACKEEVDCLDACKPGDLACLEGCVQLLRPKDNATRALGACVLDHCIEHPFGPPPTVGQVSQVSQVSQEGQVSQVSQERQLASSSSSSSNSSVASQMVPDCPSVTLQFVQSVHGRKIWPKSAWLLMSLDIDPYSKDGTDWLDAARDALDAQAAKDNYTYYLNGGDIPGHDTVNDVFRLFPRVIAIILGAVFCLVGFSYRSVVIPLRAVFTICVTLILVYGLGVLTYEHGMLEWTHFHAFQNPVGDALVWIVPALIAPISTGLGLDYDVFALSRIAEYRAAGFKTRDSILCGIGQTGSVISAAGIIMFFAFSGLSLSSNMALNQLSFFLVVSVLADTFIIRTILMPSCMIILGEANWWPSKPATLDY